MDAAPYVLRPIGRVESPLTDPAVAPKQGDEGAPDARIVIEAEYRAALDGLEHGTDVVLLTWLDRADRNTLAVHPRDDPANPMRGVFATRSADRPNPIGLHPARVVAIDETGLTLQGIEAVDGTPVIDIKPVLGPQKSL
jgi:tRNA-Thr(GGU) m(6)t(6)A37 methyltransferase TsaA